MSECEGITTTRSSKRAKITVDSHLPVLLFVYGFAIGEVQEFVSDHSILDGIVGHYSANKRIDLFFSDEMQAKLLEEISGDIGQMGSSDMDMYSKQAVLYELFKGPLYGGRAPRRGEQFRATITLHVEPARFRFMK